MRLIPIEHNPTGRQLAVFGAAWLVFFGVLGAVVFAAGDSRLVAAVLWAVALGVPLVGLVASRFMRAIFVGASYAGFPIGFVAAYLIMVVVYYLVLTPIGLAMRLFGYDPMGRRRDPSKNTYWQPRRQDDNLDRYFRQF